MKESVNLSLGQRIRFMTIDNVSGKEIEAKGDAAELYKKLQDQQVIVSLRRGWIRVSPHFYNSEEDIAHLLEHL